MTHELWKNGGSTVRTINYEYDNANQLTGADDPDAEYDYLYDNLGRVTSITADLAGLTPDVILAPQYNANGLRTVLQATIGSTADFKNDYEYDNLSRLKKLTQQDVGGGNTVADKRVEFTYNLAGQFDTITRHADLSGSSQIVATSTYAYDLTGRLDTLTHTKSGTIAGYDFGYDAANRLTSFANSQASGENASYNYDAAGQLTDADYPSQTDEDYTYDDNGNRTGGGYNTDPNNQLQGDGTYEYLYDDEGNRTRRTDGSGNYTVYVWDYRNRLESVSTYNSIDVLQKKVLYSYDPFDRLVGRKIDTDGDTDIDATEAYVYDGNQIALRFADTGSGALDAADLKDRFLWGPAVDQLLADEKVTSLGSAGTVNWALGDHQNTIRDWAQFSGGTTSIVDHAEYDSFGKRLDSPTVDSIFGWTGRYRDVDTGLQNNYHRWYDPAVGRWLSEDPIGFAGGQGNLAVYVGNSPANGIDPTGLQESVIHGPGVIYTDPSGQILQVMPDGSTAVVDQRPYNLTTPISTCATPRTPANRIDSLLNPLHYLPIFGLPDPTRPRSDDVRRTAMAWGLPGPNMIILKGPGGLSPRAPRTPLHVDIAGEGRYPNAVNVNPNTVTSTTGAPGRPIPNLVQATGEKLPFADGCAAGISVESGPITARTAAEIARTIQPGGSIRLVSPADYASIAHQRVINAVGGTVTQTTVNGITTTVITAPK